jgi:hypothetical protein
MKVLILIIGVFLSSSALACNNGSSKSHSSATNLDRLWSGNSYEYLKRLSKAPNIKCNMRTRKKIGLSAIFTSIIKETPQDTGVKYRQKDGKTKALSSINSTW